MCSSDLNDITITYAGGTLTSSATVNGTYSDVSGASPVVVSNPTGTRFYKVK